MRGNIAAKTRRAFRVEDRKNGFMLARFFKRAEHASPQEMYQSWLDTESWKWSEVHLDDDGLIVSVGPVPRMLAGRHHLAHTLDPLHSAAEHCLPPCSARTCSTYYSPAARKDPTGRSSISRTSRRNASWPSCSRCSASLSSEVQTAGSKRLPITSTSPRGRSPSMRLVALVSSNPGRRNH